MEVTINGAKSGTWLFLERSDSLYVQQDAFEEWRIIVSADTKPIEFKGQKYLPLSAALGSKFKIDLTNLAVDLTFSPKSFTETTFARDTPDKPTISPVLSSVFLNYDINYSRSYPRAANAVEDLSALTELGLSSELGVLTNSASLRNLTNDNTVGKKSEFIRLETTFTRDFPELNRTLWLGDTSTRSGMLGRNVYFGGVRFGTNFSLTPGYVSQPLPIITGLSAAPSTVELYINDVLRQTSKVPTGPFSINNFPILTGSGDARVVVRDLLGRETVFEQSFFSNGMLLATGLSDWSVEAGNIRQDLGTASGHYGPQFISGLWRNGLNQSITLEGRLAMTSKLDLFEVGAVAAIPFNALGRFALAGSHENSLGNGQQWLFSLERQNLRFGTYFEAQGATRNFRDLGQDQTVSPIQLQLAGNINYTSERLGTFSLGFAKIRQYNSPSVTTLSGNYSIRVGKSSSFILNASEAKTNNISNQSIGFNFVVSLDNNRLASAYANSSGKNNDFYAIYTQNPGQDNHLGWRTLVGQQQNKSREEAGVYYNGRYGNLSSDVSTTPDQTAMRIGANGGVIATEGHVFATQRLTNSFALAEVKDYNDIGVGLGSNMITKTNAKGIALIPNLSPYQKNSIRLSVQDLQISAEIDSIELDVVPAWRSGVKLNFPVRSGRGALLKIKLDDGGPAPSGATVQIESDKQEFYVARRGEAFVTGLQSTNHLLLNWKQQQCKFDVTLPPESPDEIPRLGPLLCQGIKR